MTATIANLTGTVGIGLDGHDTHAIASFEVPVTTSLDADGGVTLHPASPDSILAAAATAMLDAASRLLDTIPDIEVTDLPVELAPGAVILHCQSCDATLAGRPGESIEHADDGTHVYQPHLA